MVKGALQLVADLLPVPERKVALRAGFVLSVSLHLPSKSANESKVKSKESYHLPGKTLHKQNNSSDLYFNDKETHVDSLSQYLSLMAGFLRSAMRGMILLNWSILFLVKFTMFHSLSCRETKIRSSLLCNIYVRTAAF